MAAALRKNRAWLHDLLKNHLAIIFPNLCKEGLLPKDIVLPGDESCNTKANYVLEVIMNEMEKHVDECSFGLTFVTVLRDSITDELMLRMLEETAKEFKEEQSRAFRRSSTIIQYPTFDASIDGGEFKEELQFHLQSVTEAPDMPGCLDRITDLLHRLLPVMSSLKLAQIVLHNSSVMKILS